MNLRQRAERRVDAKIEFQENLYKYIVVNVIIAIICLLFMKSFWLLFIVMFFWGIGVFKDFLMAFVFVDRFSEDYRERKIKEEMEKLKA